MSNHNDETAAFRRIVGGSEYAPEYDFSQPMPAHELRRHIVYTCVIPCVCMALILGLIFGLALGQVLWPHAPAKDFVRHASFSNGSLVAGRDIAEGQYTTTGPLDGHLPLCTWTVGHPGSDVLEVGATRDAGASMELRLGDQVVSAGCDDWTPVVAPG